VPLRAPSAKRYGTSALTFGLPMRIVLSVLVTLPMAAFIGLTVVFGSPLLGIGALGAYSGFLYPRLMKDIWRRSDRR
jgi:hypothetical protein